MKNRSKRPIALVRGLFLGMLIGMSAPLSARDVIVDPYYDYRDEVERGEYRYDASEDIPWIENETEVLAMPGAGDLSPVQIDRLPDGFELLIDRSRITVDPKDQVVRAWLWTRSRAGAENGSFEGFRCDPREYKVYAYADPRRDPPVSKAKRPRWIAIKDNGYANYRSELLKDYFCGIRGTRGADEIRGYMTGEFRRERFMSE